MLGLTFRNKLVFILVLFYLAGLVSCAASSDKGQDPIEEELVNGVIQYPFAAHTKAIGRDGPEDKFIVRSTVGQTEYTIEIPGAARDYDIEIPLADLKKLGAKDQTLSGFSDDLGMPQKTDTELVRAMPTVKTPDDTHLVDGAFGVGDVDGPSQAPSYSIQLAKINKLYKARQLEYALIEINNLLTYYPSAVRLYKMKGTILVKMRNFKLAQLAWRRALELAPEDVVLKKALDDLERRMSLVNSPSPSPASQPAH